jgi:hypothetical protein
MMHRPLHHTWLEALPSNAVGSYLRCRTASFRASRHLQHAGQLHVQLMCRQWQQLQAMSGVQAGGTMMQAGQKQTEACGQLHEVSAEKKQWEVIR